MISKRILFGALLSLVGVSAYSQNIGINSTGAAADASAALDVSTSNKGVLLPRVALTGTNDVTTVSSPATSLLVYNTASVSDVTPGYYYYNGTVWVKLTDSGSNADDDWYKVGTTSAPTSINDNVFTQGNVGIGVTNPSSKLEVFGAVKSSSANGYMSISDYGGGSNFGFQLLQENTAGASGRDMVFNNWSSTSDEGGWVFTNSHLYTSVVRITKDGKVGIGVNHTPIEKLEVQGSVKIVDGTQGNRKILTSDANGKGAWEVGPVQEASNGTYKRICSGSTAPGSGWVNYSSNGIYIDINTSGCNFTNTPRYITSMGGTSSHWMTTGATSIYMPTATGFRVYVRGDNGYVVRTTQATNYGYHINWMAIGD